jgi:hypothetical protein
MKHGFLSDYFTGVGAKRLTDVEVSSEKSHQHEFNGISEFKKIFGSEKINFTARYIYLHDDEEKIFSDNGILTWYDAREGHATRTEYRLYYSENNVLNKAETGDLIVICKKSIDELFIIIAPESSSSENQLLWLFGLNESKGEFKTGNKDQLPLNFVVKDLAEEKNILSFGDKFILNELGIDIQESTQNYLENLLKKFGTSFPKTSEFSEYARATAGKYSAIDEPDETLLLWMDHEERLFKTFEKHLLQEKLKLGFGANGHDPDEFISFSLSVQNRRKARAGWAFENHIAYLLTINKIKYSKGQKTERNNKPDFIFPHIHLYNDINFPPEHLTMLGVKTSAKDRWRQVLSEADRIKFKHLITLQPAISKNQTDEMKSQDLQLVVPSGIRISYSDEQQKEIILVKDFIKLVRDKQSPI